MNDKARRARHALLHPSMAGIALGLGAAGIAHGAEWSDNSMSYLHGSSYREPFIADDVTKDTLNFTHASGYKYGGNFFTVDMLRSNGKDPAAGGGGGAHELYAVYRTTLSFGRLSGSQGLKFGPIRDVGFTAGFDFGAKDDTFASRVWKTYAGPKLSFDVPGFFDLALLARGERNHNWFATPAGFGGAGCTGTCNPDVHFKNTWAIEAAWSIPFMLGLPASFDGFVNYTAEKGLTGVGAQTKPELFSQFALMFDVGSLAGVKGTWMAGIGYQYWRNKFGGDAAADPTGGTTSKTPQLKLQLHF